MNKYFEFFNSHPVGFLSDDPVTGSGIAISSRVRLARNLNDYPFPQHCPVELKKEIMRTIHSVSDVELQTLLEKRYLCFLSWEKIAVDMHYSIQHIFRMHDQALSKVSAIMRVNESE